VFSEPQLSQGLLSTPSVVGVGEVPAGGGDVVDLLAEPRCGRGDVDDVQDLGTAEAGDLHGSDAGEGRAQSFADRISRSMPGRSTANRPDRVRAEWEG
jgi:hypothetical protein